MSIPDKQSGGVPPSSTPNAAPNTNPMPAMSPFAAHFQEQRERKKNMLMRHIDRISLSSKLVACTIAVLLIGVSVISFSIRALVNNYMLQKTDTQLSSQSQLVVNNIDLLSKNDSSGPNSYFLQIQYTDGTKDKEGNPLVVTPLMPQMQDGIVSVPILPTYGDTNGITLGQAFTTQAWPSRSSRCSPTVRTARTIRPTETPIPLTPSPRYWPTPLPMPTMPPSSRRGHHGVFCR